MTKRLICFLGAILILALGSTQVRAAESSASIGNKAPTSNKDLTFKFTLRQAALGIGYSWGQGELHYDGQIYHFRIEGGGIVALGYSSVSGQGRVFDIKKLTDFDGTYWSLSADAALGRGGNVFMMENQYGTRVNMRGKGEGAYLGASIKRLRFRLIGVDGIDRDELR